MYRYKKTEYCKPNTKMNVDNRYARGQIYTIRSHLTDKIYVGSTIQPLCKRLSEHKKAYKCYKTSGKHRYTASFEIIEIDPDCYIELYENYSCESKQELNRREGQVIRSMDCVNKVVAGRTMVEWIQDNPDYYKQYHQNNREKRTKKHECECGGRYTYQNMSTHLKSKRHKKWIFNQWQELNHL